MLDELHKLNSYKDYFSKMRISKKQITDRIELAEDIEDLMLVLFLLLPRIDDVDSLREQFKGDLLEIVSQRFVVDNKLIEHLEKTVDEIIDTTIKNIEKDDYWLSEDRAKTIAVNESNISWNYYEYTDAIESGCTRKQWLAENDNKVRPTHADVDGQEIPIDDLFVVGDSLMLYPMDTTYGADAKETINCRCACVYI